MSASADEEEDRALALRARDGDRRAFEALLDRHYATMFRMAFRWCGTRADAEDATQEACIRAARAISGFRGDAAVTTWLYQIVLSASRDLQRRDARQRSAGPDGLEEMAALDGAEDALMAGEILRALAILPEGERAALLLVVEEGLSHREAAAILGCAESTVSWRVHSARLKLVPLLEKERRHG